MSLKGIKEKHFTCSEIARRRLAIASTAMYLWIIIWSLVLKLGNEALLVNNYINLKDMTALERIMWDIVPFNYRGEGAYTAKLIMDTILNTFVFLPFGVTLSYAFKKQNPLRDAAVCLGISLLIETIQLFTLLGNLATEDIITNLAGYFLGFALYRFALARITLKSSIRFLTVVCVVLIISSVFSLVVTVGALDVIYGIVTRTL